jgi:hypothetical protein
VLQRLPGLDFHLQEECVFLRTRRTLSLLPLLRCIEVVGDWTNRAAGAMGKTALALNIAQHVALNPHARKRSPSFGSKCLRNRCSLAWRVQQDASASKLFAQDNILRTRRLWVVSHIRHSGMLTALGSKMPYPRKYVTPRTIAVEEFVIAD